MEENNTAKLIWRKGNEWAATPRLWWIVQTDWIHVTADHRIKRCFCLRRYGVFKNLVINVLIPIFYSEHFNYLIPYLSFRIRLYRQNVSFQFKQRCFVSLCCRVPQAPWVLRLGGLKKYLMLGSQHFVISQLIRRKQSPS